MHFNNPVNEYKPATSTWQLSYLLTDHLGSVVAVTDASGALISQQRYLPFGGERTDLGTISQTDYGYTGQRDLNMGLMDYKARFYSPILGRFTQPDTIIPDPYNPQDWNRYAYASNNPARYNDPTGHFVDPVTLTFVGVSVFLVAAVWAYGYVTNPQVHAATNQLGNSIDRGLERMQETFAKNTGKKIDQIIENGNNNGKKMGIHQALSAIHLQQQRGFATWQRY